MTSTLILFTAILSQTQYPDALDHLRTGNVTPQVGLLLDRSGSMAEDNTTQGCTWYSAAHRGGDPKLNKSHQMKAALIGCKTADDGLLDRWADRINFGIYDFGSGTSLRAPFGSSKAVLEQGVLDVPASGNTYMSQGLRDFGKYFQTHFDTTNSLPCRPNFIVMLSDGNPNGGSATFDYECKPPIESRTVSASQPWLGSDYLNRHDDLLCKVPLDQDIKTYTIGFGQPGSFSPSNLQNIASYGGGQYFYASDVEGLSAAFEAIITDVASKAALFFAPLAIQTGSLYSENFAFSASFRPVSAGPWRGTLKKYCVTPEIKADGSYDTEEDACLFTSPDGKTLETNPDAMDLFTGFRGLSADYGGTGEVLLDRIGAQAGVPSGSHWTKRNVITWRPGTSGYVKVNPTNWKSADTWANGCDHYKLINLLHGYTYDADCTSGAPKAYAEWPLGDPVNFAPTILRYGVCHDENGKAIKGACYVVSGSNDGMLHIYDAADGDEKTALIPAELWRPAGLTNNVMRDIMNQPNLEMTHRFYLDGDARLFHDDRNGDGIIQKTEAAYLVFGLGRGGRAYYSIPVSELNGGVLDSVKNPIHPLLASDTGDLRELRDTWAAPWMGLARVGEDRTARRVAVIGTGHIRELDLGSVSPASGSGGAPDDGGAGMGDPPPEPPDLSKAIQVDCLGKKKFADFNGLDKDKWCKSMYYDGCKGPGGKPCYDFAKVPLDLATKPLTFNDGTRRAVALRIEFARFDLESNDKLRIEDSKGNLIGEYSGTSLDGKKSPWIYDEHFVLRLVTNGIDTKHRGYEVRRVEWVPGKKEVAPPPPLPDPEPTPVPPPGQPVELTQKPSIFVLDLDAWNDRAAGAFAAVSQTSPILLRITRDCSGSNAQHCIDASTNPDLEHMRCPISAEVNGYDEGGALTALYWGDECGQIWKAWTDDDGRTYRARRLINLNSGEVAVSKDHRKIFRKIDVVSSVCTGRLVRALYFATGNVQRPAARDELADLDVTNGRDIIGVLWDHDQLAPNLTDRDLVEVTYLHKIDPAQTLASGKPGWFISLRPQERVLRDPLVFDQVAYFKSWEPTQSAPECGGGAGFDRIYAVDSCSSEAAIDEDGDGLREISERETWAGGTDIGSGFLFFTPRNSPVLVSHADLTKRQSAELNKRQRRRPTIYFFREL